MQGNLGKQERQRIDKFFAQEGKRHPLLHVCSVAFKLRAGKLEGITAEAEDVFCQVAWILDTLFSWSKVPHPVQQDIDDLWDELTQNLRNWPGSTVGDRHLITDTVFRIVCKLFCHHWDTYYCDCLYNLICTTIERESRDDNQEELQRFQTRLLDFSEQLDYWINNEYDSHLSVEIENIIKDKSEKTKRKSGRKAKDLNNIVESFSYLPTLADRGARLTAFYQSLEGRYIDRKTDQKVFIDIFQNITTTKKIVWIGEIKALRYMIDKLDKAGYITYPKGFTKWQITCAHFQIKKSQKEMADDKTCSVLNVENLQPTQFTKGGKIPDSIDDLDRIIRILDPKNNYNEALQDYLDAQQERDGEINIKEALAYGLNTDIKV